MAGGLPSASLVESVQFNQLVIVPNAVQGLFRRRRVPVAAATKIGVDGHAVRFLTGLRRKHGRGPLWINVMRDRVLLTLEVEDVRRVLEGSPHPFAADPPAKRKGMGSFQPHALTLSRGAEWEDRRRFTEAVLETPERTPSYAEHARRVCDEEVATLLEELDDELAYEPFHLAFRRIVRRVVLGDAARDDEEVAELLGEMMSHANGLPGNPAEQLEMFEAVVHHYVEAAEPGSLVSRFAEVPASAETQPEGQVTHWLFALQDTLSANALRALALIAAHSAQERAAGDEDYLRGCLHEAMRLFPTTPMLSREILEELPWGEETVPAGTQVLIVNAFHHRDRERLEHADEFAPEQWLSGDAGQDWSFNHFSHGPQGCPGVNLSMLVGSAVIGELLRRRKVELRSPGLDASKPLPHMLDFFGVRVALT